MEVRNERCRRAIADADLGLAARLLGRPYAVNGLVVVGNQIGRTIGFPTANLASAPQLLAPPCGVYATAVRLADGAAWPAATNVGVRPTVETDGEVRIEAHLIGFDGDLYGQEIEIAFVARIRAERRFASLDDLKSQLRADVEQVGRITSEVRRP
jgi:riboflavin kinase/FMN adenylyltransferase